MRIFEASRLRLLTLGAAPRIAIALAIIALIWSGFFWATVPMEAG